VRWKARGEAVLEVEDVVLGKLPTLVVAVTRTMTTASRRAIDIKPTVS